MLWNKQIRLSLVSICMFTACFFYFGQAVAQSVHSIVIYYCQMYLLLLSKCLIVRHIHTCKFAWSPTSAERLKGECNKLPQVNHPPSIHRWSHCRKVWVGWNLVQSFGCETITVSPLSSNCIPALCIMLSYFYAGSRRGSLMFTLQTLKFLIFYIRRKHH